jgi:ERCC4-type nuclease
LIPSPLSWAMTEAPVGPPHIPVVAERGGTQLRTPRPVLIVDSREQDPFDFAPYSKWFATIERRALPLGDYSIEGMENECVVERKNLSDLVHSLTADRQVFIQRMRRMKELPDALLLVDSPFGQVKAHYTFSGVNPNQITQSLISVLAGLRIPFLCVETHELGAEAVASYLYQVFLYRWLEQNDFGRRLSDSDI